MLILIFWIKTRYGARFNNLSKGSLPNRNGIYSIFLKTNAFIIWTINLLLDHFNNSFDSTYFCLRYGLWDSCQASALPPYFTDM